jgi:hypothetical protein
LGFSFVYTSSLTDNEAADIENVFDGTVSLAAKEKF